MRESISFCLLLATFFLAVKCKPKFGLEPSPCEVLAVYNTSSQFVLKDVRGLYPMLPTTSVLIRVTSTLTTKHHVIANGHVLELVTASDATTISRMVATHQRYYWIENSGNGYVDFRITLTPGIDPAPEILITIMRVFPIGQDGQQPSTSASITLTGQQPRMVAPSDVFFDCESNPSADEYRANCRDGLSIIRKDVLVAGWLTGPPFINTGIHGLEDMIVELTPDIDFWESMYGKSGHYPILDGVRIPGSRTGGPPANDLNILLNDKDPTTGADRGININSFSLPWIDDRSSADGRGHLMKIHCELNAWNIVDSRPALFEWGFKGRGAPPAGWSSFPFTNIDPVLSNNAFWPFNPTQESFPTVREAGITTPQSLALKGGDYVILKGTFFQDHSHGNKEWSIRCSEDHTGYFEIHPIDWIERGSKKAKRLASSISLIHRHPCPGEAPDNSGDTKTDTFVIHPDIFIMQPQPPNHVMAIEEVIDGRFSDPRTYEAREITDLGNFHWRIKVTVVRSIKRDRFGIEEKIDGKFKASYIFYWKKVE